MYQKDLSILLSLQNIAATIIVYFGSLAFYRLFLHPLAQFPGPKLAAITRYYEAYYDIVQNGQYKFKIAEMHKKYGPIIRISPYELHVIDPAFFEKLYRQDGRWHKYGWALDGFSAGGTTICTADHDIHKARRLPLNAFFSKAQVADKQDLIRRNVQKICDRIAQFTSTGQIVNLGAATSAFTRDVSTEFILGKSYNSLDKEDFDIGMTNVFQGSGHIWRITKHITWFGPTMKSIPVDWVIKVADDGTKAFFRYLKETTHDTKELLAAIALYDPDDKAPRTIVHEILYSKLPAKDKKFERVFDDVATVTGAGFETTASVLRLIIFHVFNNPEILDRLRNPAIASRPARISPDRELTYRKWRIPSGTPIGMTTLLMYTDENLYPDPMHFNPERGMDIDVRRKHDKTYAPFSRGTRICLGMNLAWAEMYMLLAALFQRFDFHFEGVTSKDFESRGLNTISPVTHTAFIFSATGSQGSALCQQLRDLDWNIHATTRNLESPGARILRNRGVQFTQSDWEDMDALRNSMSGCEKLFLCLHPKLDDLDYECRQAEKILKVAKEVGVKQVVASTSLGVSMLGTGIHITPDSFMAKHLAGKKGVEQAVIDGNFEHWTFLRPAFFMANFLEPKVHRYPELREKGTWTTAMTAEGKFALIDHVDIAKVATAAFQDPEKFHGCAIGLASEFDYPGDS
ncbi:uncharacterized protein EAE98_007006 [Botrytis deweyae]|uniref:NmrA-like domain-containing protein n=1 Tax=Botrytis deweyae TaxID=2478750 RepID=A0ABQ7IHU4_9HELO|nr:uncharacterized protein EAE98_007006 [Botrytis deweyae]KAF7924918.1 hypothetical protein EAE98_007006 [Botrytis deweyae]